MITEMGNNDPRLPCSLDDLGFRRDFHFDVVYDQFRATPFIFAVLYGKKSGLEGHSS
jgi:hypothetical protein